MDTKILDQKYLALHAAYCAAMNDGDYISAKIIAADMADLLKIISNC